MLLGDLDKHLRRAVRKYGVPGASVAVLRGRRITGRATAGVLNTETGALHRLSLGKGESREGRLKN